MYEVNVGNDRFEVNDGTTVGDIKELINSNDKQNIILAKVNGKLRELNRKIDESCSIEFITTRQQDGARTYMRGAIFMLIKSVYDVIGVDNIYNFSVKYSLGSGYYCEYQGKEELTRVLLDKIENYMKELVKRDIPFEKYSTNTDKAMEKFRENGMYDKEKLFRYRRVSRTNMYKLENFEDYFYGYMPSTTGDIKYFKLHLFDEGLILQLPNRSNPNELEDYKPEIKLFETLKESNNWGKMLGVDTVGALNEVISRGEIGDLMLVQEALQEKKIGKIAEEIAKNKNKKFVMIAGPSSSGKTTFSHRLSIQLMTLGLKPHPIAVDNYFKERDETPKDENGNYDFEILEAMDTELFNDHMTRLLAGERVEIPTFNFKTGKKEYKGNYLQLGKDDILVIEGIHCLNDKLSYSLPKESKYKIYISALAQINVDEHNRIPTTDGRLIRRIVRDNRTRGTMAKETIARWPSVRRGENNNIFPYQGEADVMFNSSLIYELAVLKQYVEPVLFGIDKEAPEYVEAKRLLKFLDYFVGVSSEEIPKNSILREFIGGSCFDVG